MRVLVTGGAGFIGSHLVAALLDKGHHVTVLDNEATGTRETLPSEAVFCQGDVRNRQCLDKLFKEGLDAIFHIAGQAAIIKAFDEPMNDLSVNVQGTLNIISKCIEYKVPRVLYASSMTVYGRPRELPVHEDHHIVPNSYYGITKYAAERYLLATANRTDLDFSFHVTSLRMFNVYGPLQSLNNPYQGVLAIFMGNSLRNETINIYGDGEQTRDFVYIDDVVRAWLLAMDNPYTFNQVINLGSNKEISVNQLAKEVSHIANLNYGDNINYFPTRPGDLPRMKADISRAEQLMGWVPQISFQEGLRLTYEWARSESEGRI